MPPLLDVVAESVAPERALAVSADVSQEASVVALFDATLKKFGRVDMLFNNVGTSLPPGVLLENLTLAQWQGVVDVIHVHQTCGLGSDQNGIAGWPQVQHCSWSN